MHFNNKNNADDLRNTILILCILPIFFLSCNMSGYNDLGELVNQFTQFGENATTYMRTLNLENGSGTECMTFNGDFQEGQCSWIQVLVDEQEVTVTLQMGSYEISNSKINLSYYKEYTNSYRRKPNPAQAPGAIQRDIVPLLHIEADWNHDEIQGIIQIDNASYIKINILFDQIFSQNAPNWVDQFTKIYLLNTMSAHARIEGFGGGGMFLYMDKKTVFDALRFGTMNFTVTGLLNVNSRFTYKNHGELSGITLNGTMTNQSDLNGNGEMGGTLTFEFHGMQNIWQGTIDYSHLDIKNTLPSSGEYHITIDEATYTSSCDFGNPGNFDLTDILDPDSANW